MNNNNVNKEYDFDFLVIGAGSGGVRASRIAAQAGIRVAVVEESRVGGTCVLRGCIPKKLLVYSSEMGHAMDEATNYGWTVSKQFNWETLIQNKNIEIDRLNGIYIKLLQNAGVQIIDGHASFVDAHTVKVTRSDSQEEESRQYTAAKILIASGSWPFLPTIPGIELAITSNEALELPALPKKIVVVGGGYIACEFASIFNGCGADVTQIYRGDVILRGFDMDMRRVVTDETSKKGVKIITNTNVTSIEQRAATEQNTSSSLYVCHLDNDTMSTIECDLILFATGRSPNVSKLELHKAGVNVDSLNAIIVDEWSKTTVDNIYAVGDVTNRINLTPVALAEGHAVADTLYHNKPRTCCHSDVPFAVFSQPPMSAVGLTEEEATTAFGGDGIDIYVSQFTPLKHTLSKNGERAIMKLVVCKSNDRVLGAHMVGEGAPDIIQGLAIAIKCGATKAQFDSTIGIHPTSAEEFVTMRTKRN